MKSLQNILKTEPSLSHIMNKAHWLIQVNEQVGQVLDALEPHLKHHCSVIHWDNRLLILGLSNNIWATRLRYVLPTLTKALRKKPAFSQLNKIQWKIHLSMAKSHTPQQPIHRQISPENQQLIAQCAAHTTEPALRSALMHLAQPR